MATTITTTHNRRGSKLQLHSRGKVPFSWENKPGVSKPSHTKTAAKTEYYFIKDDDYKLPPPPRVSVHGGYQLPLPPPCSFHAPISRTSSMKGLISSKAETADPFQVAIFECTKSIQNGSGNGRSEDVATKGKRKTTSSSSSPKHFGEFGSGLRSLFGSLSCKCSSSVRDDSLVKKTRAVKKTTQRDLSSSARQLLAPPIAHSPYPL
ncbi:hypothetical protein ACLB2K_018919 [Fragaria x ananassa]